ncbi:MAG: hypothetical protein FRX49_06350 [Trebouxia sp. A1-2]|nr:MAG: hypothetical protein FRX49_06350 [Trebouxia sp. A1-2]
MDGAMDGWMDRRTGGRQGGREGGMDGWKGGWMDEWMDGWLDERMFPRIHRLFLVVELFDQRRLCHPQVLPCKIESNKLCVEYSADQDQADRAWVSYPCSGFLACLSSPFSPLSPLSALTVNTRRGAHRAAGPVRAANSRELLLRVR